MQHQQSILVYVVSDTLESGLVRLPFVRALRACYPSAHITWLAGQGESVYAGDLAPLVRGLIDEVISHGGVSGRWRELFGRSPLNGRSFDLIIVTQTHTATTLTLKRIRHERFISASRLPGVVLGARGRDLLRPPSVLGQLLALLLFETGAGLPPLSPLVCDSRTEDEADHRLPGGEIYVGIAPGADCRQKCWPLDNYIALALRQAKLGNRPVILLGPGEREWEGEFRDVVPDAIFPLETGGSPLLTIALGRRLHFAVTNDSVIGHMLAVSEVPLISLFGPTSPLDCAPATPWLNIVRSQDYGGRAEMVDIPLTAVHDVSERILEKYAQAAVIP